MSNNSKMARPTKIILSLFWVLVILLGLFWISYRSKIESAKYTNYYNAEIAGTNIKGCYYKIGDEIYCGNKKDTLLGVDINSFQVLDYLVAKDKNHVYVVNHIDAGVDPQTFNKFTEKGFDLYSDKNGVYNFDDRNNKFIPFPLDINTATSVDPYYMRDKNGIYFYLEKVNNVDPSTFHSLGTCASVETSSAEYAADKDHVFVGTQILPGIDPKHFIQVAEIQSKDGEVPYTFFIWKDTNGRHIYVYCGTLIKEADYDTFEYKNGRAQDKNNYYSFNTGGGSYGVVPKK